jgi:alkylation response protein AidB-like acyl-CoA dehydrogenase
MDLRLSSDQVLLRNSVREFAEREIRPNVMAWDEAQGFPHELVRKMADLGLMGIQFPESIGGAGMSAVDYCIAIEELARVCPAVSLSVAAHNGLCSAHLFMFGSDAQKARYMGPLIRGEYLGAWGLTEAGAGSDAAAMRTTATRDGDGWVINGSKQFITHGSVGGVIVAMAVTDRAKGSKGVSAFVIPKGTPGMRSGRKENKLGMRASDTSEVLFENCRVGADALVGAEGQGFVNTLQVLDAGRIGIAALSVGLAQGAYDAALSYAKERKQFGKPIAAFQAIRWKLADLACKIEAARLLTYRAAAMKDAGAERTARNPEGAPRTSLESSIAKLYASEIAVRAAEEGVQIHGGNGFMKDYPAEKYFRDVKLCTIGEGTSEIQRLVIARQLLADPARATA